LPILDKKRFIEIYNCSKINKNQLNYLNNYIKNYSKKTVLIFNIEKFNNSISLSSILKKHKCLYFFKQPNNKELLEITLTISNLKNIFLNKNLANLIINKFEKKFLLIYNFIITSKFILNNKKITIEYIQKNITNLNFIDYLNFIKTIIKFKKKKIITYLILFINKKENPKKILYFIGWQFQIFLKIKICLNSGKELKEISKYSNTPIRHIRISFLLIEKFNTNKLKYIIKLLKTFDWMMKYLNFNQNSFIEIHNLLIKEIH
jgi:DNA polymerase III delta subunit